MGARGPEGGRYQLPGGSDRDFTAGRRRPLRCRCRFFFFPDDGVHQAVEFRCCVLLVLVMKAGLVRLT
jgi:hypothetical protein